MKVQLFTSSADGQSLTRYAAHVHALNHQWWHDAEGNRLVRSHSQLLALVMSELGEALEADRKNLMDDHLPQYPGVVVELADTVIRLLDYAGALSLTLAEPRVFPPVDVSEGLWRLMCAVAKLEAVAISDLGYHIGDTISRAETLAVEAYPSYAFWEVVYDKLCYNQQRADHKHEARAQPGGKKY